MDGTNAKLWLVNEMAKTYMEVWSQYLPADTTEMITIQDSFYDAFEPNLPIMKQNTNH